MARFAFDRALDNNADAQFVVLSQKDLVDSPASGALLEVGFTDAFRSLHPDTEAHPGPTHRNGRRIDQLYYKGRTLRNTSTRLISTWAPEFPSDHLLILSTFDLDHAATGPGRPVAPPQ